MFIVYAKIRGVEPIACGRPYPRTGNHLEAYGYPTREEAETFAATMQARFPENHYFVEQEEL